MTDNETLIYLYGIVPTGAPDPPGALTGLEDAPVRLARLGDAAAIVSELPAGQYGDDALNSHLDDLAWVGERGIAHERVLDWFAERGPVIPLGLFSLHRDLDRVEARLRAEEDSFARLLGRLEGRKEWGIKLWRQEEGVKRGIEQLSASLQALTQQIEAAPPGKRYLLERKRDEMRAEEIRAVSKRVAHELYAALRRVADSGVSIPLPADVKAERQLLVHAAFLVADAEFDTFQTAVNEQAARLGDAGFEIEFTGPWAPYHFTDVDDE